MGPQIELVPPSISIPHLPWLPRLVILSLALSLMLSSLAQRSLRRRSLCCRARLQARRCARQRPPPQTARRRRSASRLPGLSTLPASASFWPTRRMQTPRLLSARRASTSARISRRSAAATTSL